MASFVGMKGLGIWFHIGFWLLYTAIFTIVEASYKWEYQEALRFELINLPVRLLVVYFNYFVLLPRLLLRGKFIPYFGYTLATLLVAGFVQRLINYHVLSFLEPSMSDYGLWLPYKFLQTTVIIASPLIFITGISVVWRVAELQKHAKNLENEKLQAELKYLKSQINPHFLFNTLNHIYGLALEQSAKTPKLILQLADFLSFSLYESQQESIPLAKELALMNDFIALEKSRFADRVRVKVTPPKVPIDQYVIPPLILVPFVENAFKHSLKDEVGIAEIVICLRVEAEQLIFVVENSQSVGPPTVERHQGLGLRNLQQRLQILYGTDYILSIDDTGERFRVTLKIPLA